MAFLKSFLPALGLFAVAAGPSVAQEGQDKEALRKKLLQEVEKRIQQEEERILKDIERVIDEELGRFRKPGTPSAPPPAPRKVEPAPPRPVPPLAPAPRKSRGFMGVMPADLAPEELKPLGIDHGVRVAQVVEGGPADDAGLRTGDVILSVDGKAVASSQEVPPLVQAAGAGATLRVEFLRKGRKRMTEVVLGAHPEDVPGGAPPAPAAPPAAKPDGLLERMKKFFEPAAPKGDDTFTLEEQTIEQLRSMLEQLGLPGDQVDELFEKGDDGKYRLSETYREMLKSLLGGRPGLDPEPPTPPAPPKKPAPPKPAPKPAAKPWLGFQPEEVPDEIRAQLDLPEGVGLLVSEVVAGSPAEKAGLRRNDILVKIDGAEVKGEKDLAGFMAKARPGQKAALMILRKGKSQALTVTLGERSEE